MVFNRRSNLSIRPVNRIKHVVDSQQSIALGVKTVTDLVKTVDTPALANNTEVAIGSKINGIYLKVEAYVTSSGALTNFYMMVAKNPGNNLSFPNPNAVGISNDKKYVIHQEMVMFQKVSNSNPRTVFNGVIAIPRGYRRNGPDDRLQLIVISPGASADFCFQCHYKEFR